MTSGSKLLRFVWIAVLAPATFASPIYEIVDLGTLNGSQSAARSVNNSGFSVGLATDPMGNIHAVFTDSFTLMDLTPIGFPAAGQAMAASVNEPGLVAGTQWINGASYATVWIGSDGQGSAPTSAVQIAGVGSAANAINNDGMVTGSVLVTGQGHAFLWMNGSLMDLGVLPGGSWTAGYGINSFGDVAGYGITADGNFQAFVWVEGKGFELLDTQGGANSYALGINDAGQVIGSAQTDAGFLHATLWSGGNTIDLGTLGGSSSYGYGINTAGDAVGYSLMVDGQEHAFVFTQGVMFDLNDLIDPNAGWILNSGYDVNDQGQIVGRGTLNGVEHAFLLDPVGALSQVTTGEDGPAAAARSFVDSGEGGGASQFADLNVASVPEPDTWVMAGIGLMLITLARMWQRSHPPAKSERKEEAGGDRASRRRLSAMES